MAVKVSGNRGLNFVGTFQIDDIEKNAKKVIETFTDLHKQANNVFSKSTAGVGVKEHAALTGALEQNKLALQKLREEKQLYIAQQEKGKASVQSYKAEMLRLKVAEQELKNQYSAGRIALVEYTLEQKKLVQAEKEAAKQKRESIAASKELLKANRDQEEQLKHNITGLEQEVTLLKKMQREASIYQKGMEGMTNPELIDKYNRKLNDTLRIIQQLQPKSSLGYSTPAPSTQGVQKELNEQVKTIAKLGEGWKSSAKEQAGAIERVKAQLKSLNEQAAKAPAAALPKINKEIEVTKNELKRLSSIGTKAFDDTDNSAKKVEGTLNRLKRAAELYKQAATGTSNPELISKYNAKLQETEQRIRQVSTQGKQGFDAMGNKIKQTTSGIGSLVGSLKGMLASVGLIFGVQEIIQFGKELFGLAKKAQGVELAFGRIGTSADLEVLRKQTKGTVSDLQLMQAAVKASNFRIPMDTLGKGLAFAQQRARDTGQEVDYLVESLVTGIGRKSPLILDNLGISVIEVQKEFQKTGDFATAVGNIIDREMQRSGEAVDYLADRTGRMSSTWENIKTGFAQWFGEFIDPTQVDADKIGKITEQITKEFGNIDRLAKGQVDTVLYQLLEQRKQLDKQRADLVRQVKKGDISDAYGIAQDKWLKEESMALDNVIQKYQKQSTLLKEQSRIRQGLLSVTEMQAKVEELTKEANERIIYGQVDRDFVTKKLKEAAELQKKIDEIVGKGDDKKAKKEEDKYKKDLNKRLSLLAQIGKAEDEFTRGGLSKDEEEKKALEDRFRYLRDQIEKFNKEVAVSLRIDLGMVDKIETKAFENLIAKQEVDATKLSIEEQKTLYTAFETYKAEFGADAAKKRFAGEISEFESYIAYLRSLLPKDSDTSVKAVRMREALKPILQKAEQEEHKRQLDTYNKLLKSLITYEDERLNIQRAYQENRKKLMIGGDILALEELDRQHQVALDALDDANAKKLQNFQSLFEGVDQLSDKQARAVVQLAENKLKELVAQGRISKKLEKEIKQLLTDTTGSINDRLPKRLLNLSASIKNVAGAVEGVDKGFANILNTVSDVIGAVVQIKDSLAAVKEAQKTGDLLSGISGAMGIVSSVMMAINFAKSLADSMAAKEERRQQRRDEQRMYEREQELSGIEAITKALDRQLALIKDVYGTERIEQYRIALTQTKAEYEALAKTLSKRVVLTGVQETDDLLKKYNDGTATAYQRKMIEDTIQNGNGLIYNLEEIIARLGDVSTNSAAIEDLQRLMDKGLLDDNTAKEVAALVELGEKYRDTLNTIREETTGTSIGSLVDDIAQMFAEGKDSVEDFTDFFEKKMEAAVLNSFKRKSLERSMQQFYEGFSLVAEDGLTEEEISTLRDEYLKKMEEARKEFEALNNIAGTNIGAETGGSNQNTLSGAIRAQLTEETGGKLAGIYQGIFGLNKQQLVVQEGMLGTLGLTLDVARQNLNYSMQTAQNTRLNAESSVRIEGKLEEIAKNTKPAAGSGASARDLGYDG